MSKRTLKKAFASVCVVAPTVIVLALCVAGLIPAFLLAAFLPEPWSKVGFSTVLFVAMLPFYSTGIYGGRYLIRAKRGILSMLRAKKTSTIPIADVADSNELSVRTETNLKLVNLMADYANRTSQF